ncbi:MAG: LPS export ABC transporter ATP-binding protein [Candidatus Eisenbacteria bacterium]|uniref:LPS export ABC transporter ATP-binding protein n=1 Tax=Eiseniibacteriota bacterium TaxID=2212470 RepID=A0A956N980_UNCEI|nr:LPS export ABC transporter ATP-binding protein [Candidatus Eisenbacteria bacterium]MCB9462545.1 LPS export ABC transporter ATP-binding protein [Candidatus Eisenbacteria bacterium]
MRDLSGHAARPVHPGALAATDLVRKYGKLQVVKGVSLVVEPGEVVGLLGPNGAGKSTTFYMIVGQLPPTSGRIYLAGQDVTKLPMYRRARMGIGYLSQEPSVFRRLTVWENVMAILETVGISKDEREERCANLLTELDILHLRDRRGYQLSGGERRRVEISRALVTRPSFILLDEPFVGIDPIAVGEIRSIILALKDRGLGVLITDHSVRECLSATDRAYLMYDGRILLSGSAEQLAADPQARKLYLGEDFRL